MVLVPLLFAASLLYVGSTAEDRSFPNHSLEKLKHALY